MRNKKPILITGSHRSGTTWIGQTVSQQSKVWYVNEPFNVAFPSPLMNLKLDAWFEDYASSSRQVEIRREFDRLLNKSPLGYAAAVCAQRGRDLKTPVRFGKHVLVKIFRNPRVLVKDPIALFSAEWLYETYGFDVIVTIRNPLAFVGSVKVAGWDFDFRNLRKQNTLMQDRLRRYSEKVDAMCDGDSAYDAVDRAALLWNVIHHTILDYQRRHPEWLFVKYEDVASEPDQGFRRVFDYLGLNMTGRVRDYIQKYTSSQNPGEAKSDEYQPRNSKLSVQTWKNRLSPDEVERVTAATKEVASEFYGENNGVPSTLLNADRAPSIGR